MFYEGHGWYIFGHGVGMLFWLVILILVIWLLVKLLGSKTETNEPVVPNAYEILAERFARGEIDEEEYLKRKSFLDKHLSD